MFDSDLRRWLSGVWKNFRRKARGSASVRPPLRLEVLESSLTPTAPGVLSVMRANPIGPFTNGTQVSYLVTFDQAVTGVDPTDFQLGRTGTLGTTLTQITPVTAMTFAVTVSGITGSGDLTLGVTDDDSIRSANAEPL